MLEEQLLPVSILLAAVALDLLLGDPPQLPHPVRGLGAVANIMERLFRSPSASPRVARLLGAGSALLLMLFAATLAGAAVVFMPLEGVVALYLSYAGLALGQLRREARRVLKLTAANDSLSRNALQMLVSRDTSQLSVEQVRQTLAETVSENASDGFVAPFFYLALFGPPGLWAYKAISTLDSMWGYKTQEYKHFGWGAARMDDLLNFVPARITAVAILTMAWLRGFLGGYSPARLRRAWRYTVRDARKTSSPNAGWPMAAAAWGLGAGMGGQAVYFGQRVEKPWLGPPRAGDEDGRNQRVWTQRRCENLVEICTAACLAAAVALHLCVLAVSWLGYFTV